MEGHFWLILGPCSNHLHHIYTPRDMKWFKFSLPIGNYFINWKLLYTIKEVGPWQGHIGAKLSGHVRAIF